MPNLISVIASSVGSGIDISFNPGLRKLSLPRLTTVFGASTGVAFQGNALESIDLPLLSTATGLFNGGMYIDEGSACVNIRSLVSSTHGQNNMITASRIILGGVGPCTIPSGLNINGTVECGASFYCPVGSGGKTCQSSVCVSPVVLEGKKHVLIR